MLVWDGLRTAWGVGLLTDPCWRFVDDRYTLKDVKIRADSRREYSNDITANKGVSFYATKLD